MLTTGAVMQGIFETADLAATGWLCVIGVASTVLWFEELHKLVSRRGLARTNSKPHPEDER